MGATLPALAVVIQVQVWVKVCVCVRVCVCVCVLSIAVDTVNLYYTCLMKGLALDEPTRTVRHMHSTTGAYCFQFTNIPMMH